MNLFNFWHILRLLNLTLKSGKLCIFCLFNTEDTVIFCPWEKVCWPYVDIRQCCRFTTMARYLQTVMEEYFTNFSERIYELFWTFNLLFKMPEFGKVMHHNQIPRILFFFMFLKNNVANTIQVINFVFLQSVNFKYWISLLQCQK